MTDTRTQTPAPEAAADDGTSEMTFGAGETAWLAVVTVLAALGVALGIIAVVIANDSGGTAAPAATGGGAATEASVSAAEFAFDPADIDLVAGTEATVTLTNDGAVEHNWTVLNAGEEISAESDFDESMALGAVDNTAVGESNSVALTLEAGDYQVICTVPGHFDAGMQGTVTAS